MNTDHQPGKLYPVFLNSSIFNILIVGYSKPTLDRLARVMNEGNYHKITIITNRKNHVPYESKNLPNDIIILDQQLAETDFQNFDLAYIFDEDGNEEKIKSWAEKCNVLVNFDGRPEYSDFQPASLINKGNFKMALFADKVSTGTEARIKNAIDKIIPDEIGELIGNLKKIGENPQAEFRKKVYALNKISRSISAKKNYVDPFSELENTTKIVKTARLKANLYLGIIGVLVFIGLFIFTLYQFDLYPDVKEFLFKDHSIFLWMLLVGFLAELVAGSMGMGYGVICTTILLLLGVAPPIVSASIHSAESFTTAAGSFSHYKLRNVNFKLVKRMAPYAILGAIIGAVSLTYFGEHYAHIVKPLIALYTLYVGANILRKSLKKNNAKHAARTRSNLTFLGIVGGFIDSFAGGGWGPLVTGSLIKDGRTPRYVVGSSTVIKFLLTVTSAVTFIFTIGIHHWNIVLGLLLGGVITAPFSAMLTAKLPVKKMTIAISILVIIMSLITIFKSFLK